MSGVVVAIHGTRFAWNMTIRGLKLQVWRAVGMLPLAAVILSMRARRFAQAVPSGISDDQFLMWTPARDAAGPPTFKDKVLVAFTAMQERLRRVPVEAPVAA